MAGNTKNRSFDKVGDKNLLQRCHKDSVGGSHVILHKNKSGAWYTEAVIKM